MSAVRRRLKGCLVVIMADELIGGKAYLPVEGGSISFDFGEAGLAEDLAQRTKTFVHFPAKSVGRVVLLAELAFPYRIHRWSGKWVFCRGRDACLHCKDRVGWKGKRCVPVFDQARRVHGAFDFTPECWQVIEEQCMYEGSKLGRVVAIRKENQVVNGKFLVELMHQVPNPEQLGTPCDVPALICKTYGLQLEEFNSEFLDTYYSRVITPAPPFSAARSVRRELVE